MDALWDAAMAFYEPQSMGWHMMRLARKGHRNARAIVEAELDDVTGCPCGAEELCSPDIDTPQRVAKREALTALLAAMTEAPPNGRP